MNLQLFEPGQDEDLQHERPNRHASEKRPEIISVGDVKIQQDIRKEDEYPSEYEGYDENEPEPLEVTFEELSHYYLRERKEPSEPEGDRNNKKQYSIKKSFVNPY